MEHIYSHIFSWVHAAPYHTWPPPQDSCSRAFGPFFVWLQLTAGQFPNTIDGAQYKRSSESCQSAPEPPAQSGPLCWPPPCHRHTHFSSETWLCRLLSSASFSSPPLLSPPSPMSRRHKSCAAQRRTRTHLTPSPSTPVLRQARSTPPTSPTGMSRSSPRCLLRHRADGSHYRRGIYSGYNFRACYITPPACGAGPVLTWSSLLQSRRTSFLLR